MGRCKGGSSPPFALKLLKIFEENLSSFRVIKRDGQSLSPLFPDFLDLSLTTCIASLVQ